MPGNGDSPASILIKVSTLHVHDIMSFLKEINDDPPAYGVSSTHYTRDVKRLYMAFFDYFLIYCHFLHLS